MGKKTNLWYREWSNVSWRERGQRSLQRNSWYNVCNVSRHPAKSPRRNSASHPAGSFSYAAWKVFRRNSPCAASLLIVSAFCIGCMGGIVILKHGTAFGEHHGEQSKGQPFNEAA